MKKEEGADNISSESMVTSSAVFVKEDMAGQDSGLEIQEKDVLKEDYEAMKLENAKLEAKLQALEKELEGQRALIEGNAEKLEASKQKCKMFEGHSSLLAFHVHELSERRELLEDELDFREAQLEDLEAKNKEATKKMQEEHNVEMMEKVLKIKGLEKEVSMLKKENAQMKEDLEEKGFDKEMEELDGFKKDVKDQPGEMKENAKELKTTKEKCEVMEGNKSFLAVQLQNTSKMRAGLEEELVIKNKKQKNDEVKYEEEIMKLKAAHRVEMEKKELEIERLQKEMSKYHEEQDEIKKELQEAKLQLQARQVANDAIIGAMELSCMEETEKYEKEIKGLRSRVNEEEIRKKAHIKKKELMIYELAELREELHVLRNTRERRRKEHHWLAFKIDEMISENAEVHTKLLDEREEMKICQESFQVKIDGLEMECLRLEHFNTKLEEEFGIVKEQLESEENKNKKMEREMFMLCESVRAKELVIQQFLQEKPKKRGIRRILCC